MNIPTLLSSPILTLIHNEYGRLYVDCQSKHINWEHVDCPFIHTKSCKNYSIHNNQDYMWTVNRYMKITIPELLGKKRKLVMTCGPLAYLKLWSQYIDRWTATPNNASRVCPNRIKDSYRLYLANLSIQLQKICGPLVHTPCRPLIFFWC